MFLKESPYRLPWWLYQLTFPPTVQERSLFSTPSPAFIVGRLFDDGHSDRCEVISHCSFDLHFSNNDLEPDILECEVKWALESITTNKASGGDGIPVELFQILKDDAVKSAALNTPANLENSAVATGLEKVSFHSNPKERQCQRMLKTPHNCTHLTC